MHGPRQTYRIPTRPPHRREELLRIAPHPGLEDGHRVGERAWARREVTPHEYEIGGLVLVAADTSVASSEPVSLDREHPRHPGSQVLGDVAGHHPLPPVRHFHQQLDRGAHPKTYRIRPHKIGRPNAFVREHPAPSSVQATRVRHRGGGARSGSSARRRLTTAPSRKPSRWPGAPCPWPVPAGPTRLPRRGQPAHHRHRAAELDRMDTGFVRFICIRAYGSSPRRSMRVSGKRRRPT